MCGSTCPVSTIRRAPHSWTFWGGALGPAMLHHVRCLGCGTKYNGKTGNYNTTGITIYMVISSLIALAVMVWIMFAM
ncbi:MAG: hypothetical protein HQ567_31420 [Candidatus Nealsonbacteria bacterium]|nr:hypothetical protein [Candidatus Nealsonbacteria bacterium]